VFCVDPVPADQGHSQKFTIWTEKRISTTVAAAAAAAAAGWHNSDVLGACTQHWQECVLLRRQRVAGKPQGGAPFYLSRQLHAVLRCEGSVLCQRAVAVQLQRRRRRRRRCRLPSPHSSGSSATAAAPAHATSHRWSPTNQPQSEFPQRQHVATNLASESSGTRQNVHLQGRSCRNMLGCPA
jgi:hypothetical protein